jgi:hypothetical protein
VGDGLGVADGDGFCRRRRARQRDCQEDTNAPGRARVVISPGPAG